MSAELMESKFVRHPSVSQLPLNLLHGFLSNFMCGFSWTIRRANFLFLKKKIWEWGGILYGYISFSLTWDPYGSENFKMLLVLQIAAEKFQSFPEFSFQWFSQNYHWEFLKC